MLKYQQQRQKPVSKIRKYSVERRSLNHIFVSAEMERREHLRTMEILSLLQAYDFPLAAGTLVQSAAEAMEFYQKIKQPLVLKIEAEDILHKSDSGGGKETFTK